MKDFKQESEMNGFVFTKRPLQRGERTRGKGGCVQSSEEATGGSVREVRTVKMGVVAMRWREFL